jgi:hypothetical protein
MINPLFFYLSFVIHKILLKFFLAIFEEFVIRISFILLSPFILFYTESIFIIMRLISC